MSSSILTSTKKLVGLAEDDTTFDLDVLMHINSTFSFLEQLGVGPVGGFMIEDAAATWEQFLGSDPRLNQVKTLMSLKVRLLFDPPTTSYLISAYEKQIEELTWRIHVNRENQLVPVLPTVFVIDGGDASGYPEVG